MADGLLNKASIILTPTGYKAGTLYNVAPVVEPYEDFDFARASVASRVNSSGLVEMVGRTLGSELVTNGDFATDSDWSKTSQVTINNGVANILSNDGSFQMLGQNNVVTIGKSYVLTYTIVSANNGSLKFSNFGQINSTVGTHKFYFVATETAINIARNSVITDISIDNVSVKEIIDTNNIPRISYDSNGDNGHILLEPTSTNLVTYSEDFSQSVWTKTNSSVTSGFTSPNGTNNAYSLIENTSTGVHFIQSIISVSNSTIYTASIFVKYAGREWIRFTDAQSSNRIHFNTQTGEFGTISGTVISYNKTALENGWYKLSLTTTSVATAYAPRISLAEADNDVSYTGNGTSGVYLWGAQIEALPYATSYIPTLTGSTVTRATETATGAGSATLINSTEGVLYAEIAAFEVQPDFFISMNDGTNNNRVIIKFSDGVDNLLTAFTINSTNASSITHTISNFKQYNKIALSYNSSYLKLFVNGQEVGTSVASPNLPVGLNVLNLSNLLTDKNVKGKVKALAVFNEALSDAELNNLTG